MKKLLLSLGLMVAGGTVGFAQSLITQWTFETSLPGLTNSATITNLAAEVGTGTASGVHASANTDWSNPSGNGSVESFSVNEWAIGDFFQFDSSTLGYSGISVSWSQTRSSTGPTNFSLAYSTDGATYTTNFTFNVLLNDAVNGGAWNTTSNNAAYSFYVDLSSVSALNNAALVSFRIVNNVAAGATGGTGRIDDFAIVAIPEPSQMALLGFGALSLAVYRIRSMRRVK